MRPYTTLPLEQSPFEKLTFPQLVNKFFALYGTWKLVTVIGPYTSQINPVHILKTCFFKTHHLKTLL